MFEYIFGITWKEYTTTQFDSRNFSLIYTTLPIALIIGYLKFGIIGAIIGFLIWAIIIRLFGMGGSLIF